MCTIGYGDLKPVGTEEYIVAMVLELVAGVTFAYIISTIGSLFGRYNLLAESFLERQQFVL